MMHSFRDLCGKEKDLTCQRWCSKKRHRQGLLVRHIVISSIHIKRCELISGAFEQKKVGSPLFLWSHTHMQVQEAHTHIHTQIMTLTMGEGMGEGETELQSVCWS